MFTKNNKIFNHLPFDNMIICLKGTGQPENEISHYLLIPIPVESRMIFGSPQNISGPSLQRSVEAFSETSEVDVTCLQMFKQTTQKLTTSTQVCANTFSLTTAV